MGRDDMDSAKRNRLLQATPVKEDLAAIFGLADDTFMRLAGVARAITQVQEQLTAVAGLVDTLKAQGATQSTEITLLHSLAEGVSQELEDIQATTMGIAGAQEANATQNAEILASVVETLLGMNDLLETVRVALVGLTTQVQDRGSCPWRQDGAEVTAASLFTSIAQLGTFAPRLALVIEDRLKSEGRDPDTGKKYHWFRRTADKLLDSMHTALLTTAAINLIGWGAYLWQNRTPANRTDPAVLQHLNKMQTTLEQNAVRLQQLQTENDTLRAETEAKKASAPRHRQP
jgi:hypothetical protein